MYFSLDPNPGVFVFLGVRGCARDPSSLRIPTPAPAPGGRNRPARPAAPPPPCISVSPVLDHLPQLSVLAVLQGATDAHEFFVLESGSCDVFVGRPGDITPKKVKGYGAGSAFGELALLYAAPRAATVSHLAVLLLLLLLHVRVARHLLLFVWQHCHANSSGAGLCCSCRNSSCTHGRTHAPTDTAHDHHPLGFGGPVNVGATQHSTSQHCA